MTIDLHFPRHYKHQADAFFDAYRGEEMLVGHANVARELARPNERVCRFCSKKSGEVTFKKKAHMLPRKLGNEYFKSDFECDECNAKFSIYENDLMHYIGLERTLVNIFDGKKIPGFESKDLKAKKRNFLDDYDGIKIEAPSPESTFNYNKETGEFNVKFRKPPYTPIHVFKALLKMALCLVRESEVTNYSNAFRFLSSEKYDHHMQNLFLFGYRLPISYDHLSCFLFRKKKEELNTTTHTFILCYRSKMFQIFLPLFDKDIIHYTKLSCPLMPPFFDNSGDESWRHQGQIRDNLSSGEVKSDDSETFSILFNKDSVNSCSAIDLITKTVSSVTFNPQDINAFYLVPAKTYFDLLKKDDVLP